jgi:prephenate dehydratase
VLGQYIFLVDINGHREEAHVARALARIRARTGMFKVFGSYPRWKG